MFSCQRKIMKTVIALGKKNFGPTNNQQATTLVDLLLLLLLLCCFSPVLGPSARRQFLHYQYLRNLSSPFKWWGGVEVISTFRAVFKWLSKVIPWLRMLRLVIGLRDSRQFFNQWDAKPKSIAPCTRDLSRASSELHVIARNCDWFIAQPAPFVIGRSNCFGFGFSTVIWKPL